MKRALLALSIAAAVLVSGCMDMIYREPLHEEEAEKMADEAIVALEAAIADFSGDGLKRMEGTVSATDEMMGSMQVELVVEWGLDDARRFTIKMGGSGMTMDIQVFCSPERMITVIGDAYEARATGADCLSDAEPNGMEVGENIGGDGLVPFEGLTRTDIIVTDHTFVTALYEDEKGNIVTLELDSQGRAKRFASTGPEGDAELAFFYGERRTIPFPTPSARIPMQVELDEQWVGDVGEEANHVTIVSVASKAPLSEFEVRIGVPFYEADEDGIPQQTRFDAVASFPLTDGEAQASGSWHFTFHDEDEDGFLSTGDWFQAREDVTPDNMTFAQPVLWDLWADGEVNSSPIPGVGTVVAALALLGAAVYVNRRRRSE